MTLITRIVQRSVGVAATGGLLFGGAAMAEVRPADGRSEAVPESISEPIPAEAPAAEIPVQDASLMGAVPASQDVPAPAVAAPQAATAEDALMAQTYPQPVVKEVYSAKGWYLTIGAGYQQPSDQTVNSTGTFVSPFFSPLLFNFGNNNSTKLDLGGGFSGDVGVGYDFGALRAELTYGYSRSSLNAVGAANPIGFGAFGIVPFTDNVSGVINKNDLLVSLYYDIETNSRWTPYIGGGVGYTNLSTPSFSLNGIPTNSVNKGLFGWQAKVGVSYAMNYNSDLYLEGVYQGAGGYSTENVSFDAFNSFGGKIGFRYRFGARPVAAAPAPTPEPEPIMQPAPAPAPIFQPEPAPAPIRGLW
ncbi:MULTISPECIES: outer membrane protein [unclassified Cyanobium]|uniref:outer membrane protein n=1 Tax=unclassified Cyanobium TaxID=2627006 RepID=UPI0020CE8C19|nr:MULTISPECIES: outer membrane beta-barrel protein [unclassified Cyanobium]MCP9798009.1 porin family protein [Cyanobium sp. Lug-B]MCP9932483.1 porin family protein [Cyanobium sp. Candia 9D4]